MSLNSTADVFLIVIGDNPPKDYFTFDSLELLIDARHRLVVLEKEFLSSLSNIFDCVKGHQLDGVRGLLSSKLFKRPKQ